MSLKKLAHHIFLSICADLVPYDYISVSNGLEVIGSSAATQYCNYHKNAVVPKEPWRPINKYELDCLGSNLEDLSFYNTVALVRLDESLQNRLLSFDFSQIAQDLNSNQNLIHMLVTSFFDDISSFNTCEYQLFNSIAVNQPQLPTVTFDNRTSKFLGLHVDSFDGGDIQQRAFSSNRICLNVSREDRFFLFINKSLVSILDEIQEARPKLLPVNPKYPIEITELAYLFARCRSDYPVIRLRCPPGYAYIAPTENIIHDGSSSNQTCLDVSMSFRGYFAPNPDQVINDSPHGAWDLLEISSLLSVEECKEILIESLGNKEFWKAEILARLNQLFQSIDSHLIVRLIGSLQLYRLQSGFSKAKHTFSALEFGRHVLVICLNDDFDEGQILIPSADYMISGKIGDGLVFSKCHHCESLPVYNGEKILLIATIHLASSI